MTDENIVAHFEMVGAAIQIAQYQADIELFRRAIERIKAGYGEACEVRDADDPEDPTRPGQGVNDDERCAVCAAHDVIKWMEHNIESWEIEIKDLTEHPEYTLPVVHLNQLEEDVCDGCGDLGWLISERSDGQHAVECCDMCQQFDDDVAAQKARAVGIACAETYPHVLLDQSPEGVAAAHRLMEKEEN